MTCDLLIKNGTILPIAGAPIEGGFVAVAGEKIVCVGQGDPRYTAKKVIDAAGDIVMPGMVNCHTHVPMILYRGIGNDVKDIFSLMFPLEKGCTTREMCRVGAQISAIEFIRSGVTCFADMYYFEDAIAEVIDRVGLRAILGETIINFPAPDAPEPYGGFELAKRFVQEWKGHPRITPAFAPHAPYTVDDAMFKKVQAEPDAPILTHLAETTKRVDTVTHLKGLGLLSKRLTAAHCIHVSESGIEALEKYGVGVGLCMESNAKGGCPTGRAQAMYRADVRAGLGTDGAMSSNTSDIFSQMRLAGVLEKHDLKDRAALEAHEIVEMATLGGAKALHMEERIGTLEAGKLADLIIVKRPFPSYDPYQGLVYATFPSHVRTTIVHGQILMEESRLLTIDPESVQQAAEPILAKVREFLERNPSH